jgi:hypothetical protein
LREEDSFEAVVGVGFSEGGLLRDSWSSRVGSTEHFGDFIEGFSGGVVESVGEFLDVSLPNTPFHKGGKGGFF